MSLHNPIVKCEAAREIENYGGGERSRSSGKSLEENCRTTTEDVITRKTLRGARHLTASR